jgi:glutamine amidotransferase
MHEGLNLLPGKVLFFSQENIKVPQIGWNQVERGKSSPLLENIETGDYFYFNHSYYCAPEDESDVLTWTDYGLRFASSASRENVFGVQFHPEKSQKTGLQILKNFVEI